MAAEPLGRTLILNEAILRRATEAISTGDERLGRLHLENGPPPLWARPPGFPTLVKIILEQQVSLDSAAAAFSNLENAIGSVSPERFLRLDGEALKRIGFSRQKTGYCRGLASGILDGSIDLAGLADLSDDMARESLMLVRGIGRWTADVYLLFVLRRPDVWPLGDRALVVSMAENLPLAEVPTYEEAAQIASAWVPWRSVAARMFWHAYLRRRGRALD